MATVTQSRLTPAARRVLRTAGELFYERGINSVGMELIAERAGVTKKTVYDRFGSKGDLVLAYLRERDERWRGWLTERVERADTQVGQILATFDALTEWMGDNYRGCAMLNAYAELPDPDHPGRKLAAAQKTWLRDQYARLLTGAGHSAPDRLAEQLFMLHEGALVSAYVARHADAVVAARAAAATLLAADGVR